MTQTASTYAKIFWELGIPKDKIGESLSIFKENPELMTVFCDPAVHLEDKEAAVDRIFPEEMKNSIKVLCRYNKVASFEDIVAQYQIYADENSQIVNATLTYVTPPNAEQMEGIRSFLKKTYQAEGIDLKEYQDPSLVGGFILTAGDEEYDWSLKGRIEALGQKLTGGEDG